MTMLGFRSPRWIQLAACVLALASAAPVTAAQHLIRAGEDWQSLEQRLRPGDEIILMPGRHRSAEFTRIVGAAQKPITIRSADPANRSLIEGGRDGIRIDDAAHVVIRDLGITGAKINGIHIAAVPHNDSDTKSAPESGNIVIRNVTITHIGPQGQRHGVLIRNVKKVRIENCRFEGWGGSGIEILNAQRVHIAGCHFNGLEDHSQINGIRMRAGSENVEIDDCRFEDSGEFAICIGWASRAEEFAPMVYEAATQRSLFEAKNVLVQRCTIVGSDFAIGYVHAADSSVRNTTIVRPKSAAFALVAAHTDTRFHAGKGNFFGRNLVTWEPGQLPQFAYVHRDVDPSTFSLDANLWWSREDIEQREKMGSLPGKQMLPQIFDIDPKLDEYLRATAPQADGFGF